MYHLARQAVDPSRMKALMTAKWIRIHQVSSVVVWESTYENLEDSSMVISDRCPPGSYRQCCRYLSQEHLRQRNPFRGCPGDWTGHRQSCRCRCAVHCGLFCQQRISQSVPDLE